MKNTQGYSGTPLVKKLGIKSGFRVKTKNAPVNYLELIAQVPDNVKISSRLRGQIDMWHIFSLSRNELSRMLVIALSEIKQDGMVWVSWPKKSSGVVSEITEDTIRDIALPMGLVDIKVCAINEIWSGLKLVIRKELRK